jgi:hypothetical protein
MSEAQPQTTTTNTAEASKPVTPAEANAALMTPQRVEASEAIKPPEPTKPEEARPDWLPAKFKTPADMAKAYGELEKKLGGKPTTPDTTKPGEAEKPTDLQIKQDAQKAEAEAKGLDLKPFEDEFTAQGKLSEKSYEALAKAGIPKDRVDAYIAGQQALAERSAEATLKSVGLDMDGYKKMAEWAQANVPKGELEAYNKIVTGADPEAAKIALTGLQAKFKAAQEPDFLRGADATRSTGDVYRSTAEMTKDMNDPRYRTDPAFRQAVAEKLGRSNIL